MKIDGNLIDRLLLRETVSRRIGRNEQTDNSDGKRTGPNSEGALRLSREAAVLEKALRIMEKIPDIDSALVERTAERIKNGSYTVNSAEVARKITGTLKGE